MKRTRVVIVGFGALGKACAQLAATDPRLEVAGFVRRAAHVDAPRPAPFHAIAAVAHVSELARIDAALAVGAVDLERLHAGERA